MTRLAELRSKFVAWDNALTQYNQTAMSVMLAFLNGFCKYLGYNPETDGKVFALHKIDFDANGRAQHVPIDDVSEALTQDADGIWHFGITMTLQEGMSFEQQVSEAITHGNSITITSPHLANFYFHIKFSLRDVYCNFQNADDQTHMFAFTFVDNVLGGPPDAYIYFTGILETIFNTNPGEPPVQQPIGFDLPSRRRGRPRTSNPPSSNTG
jgi:hypothetical protein